MVIKSKYIILLSVLISFWHFTAAQNSDLVHTRYIYSHQDTIQLDSLIILPSSFKISSSQGNILDTAFYTILFSDSKLILSDKLPQSLYPITTEFKVFPFDIQKPYYHKKFEIRPSKAANGIDEMSYYRYTTQQKSTSPLGLDDFQKSGNISRAISVGNQQNVSVLSHLNLQISGRISEELELLASISDDNIPIQPDGNTQQLQDFDKVFIQIKHKNGQLTAGDFEMKNPNSFFLRYYKKAQGANASVNLDLNSKTNLKVYGGIALSRGKYARNTILGIEGNQGPYKLVGANFERAIIVLSGTEQVYVDGKLLKRGQNYDYIIDYNSGEITFMPSFPINKDKRISVEFQYSNRNYARYLANAGFEYSNPKWKLATHYYVENDLKDQPLDMDLSAFQQQLLYSIGDSLQYAISPSVDSVGFNDNEVLYKKIDSLGYSPVYVYSNSPDSAIYRLAFSLVGAGNGNYQQQNSSANGRVFKWVAPVNGIKQGDYEPVILLVTPKKKQLLTGIAEYRISKNTFIHTEVAVSNEDLNTFSPYDKENNTAPAFKINFQNIVPLSKSKKTWNLTTKANYEYTDANFKPIERFRSVEFSRDWNANDIDGKAQQLASLSLNLEKENRGRVNYAFEDFRAKGFYSAQRNAIGFNLKNDLWRTTGNASYTSTTQESRNTIFFRHYFSLERNFKYIKAGILENAEDNQFRAKTTDSLMLNSFRFQEVEAFVQTKDTAKQFVNLHYKWRRDLLPKFNSLNKAMDAQEIGFKYSFLNSKANRINLIANYRLLQVVDSSLTTIKPQETANGRIEHILNVAKGSIKAQTFYQLGSGMETAKEFSYLEVAAGQGVYSWIDYNENGVKELNEFEIAAFQDQANYIRIYLPSTDYVKTYNNQFSTSIMLNPSRVWRRSEVGFLRFVSHFSNQLVYRSSIKTLNSDWFTFANPFSHQLSDDSLMNLNSSFRNTFYFNRSHPKFGADYTFSKNENKILMMNGYESRFNKQHQLKLRWNLSRKFLVQIDSKYGNKSALSDYFESKEFDINFYEEQLKVTYQPNRVFRIALPISFGEKKNIEHYGGQRSQSFKIGLQSKYSLLEKGSFTFDMQRIDLVYNSETNSSVTFEMLEGLLPGTNYTWNISYRRTLLRNLQLSVIYNGRKSEANNAIHVGSVQLRAFF